MLKSKLLLIAIPLFLTACAHHSSMQTYRTTSGESLSIKGVLSPGLSVTIFINGETVIDSIPYISENMVGNYKGMKVMSKCRIETHMFSSDKECDIYINEQYASNLYFR